jgi:two-component system LytT family response regulator
MITALIIDDEQHCIERLKNLLENNFSSDIEIIGKFSSIDDGVRAIKTLHPEVVFLDVQIEGDRTGFDLLKQLDKINFDVIFTTAFEKYAVQAFKFSAIDYLLKPVDKDDLEQAIQKLKEKHSSNETAGKFDVLFHNLKNLQGASKRICVPVINGLVVVQITDIVRCESSVNYTTIYLKDKQKITVAKTLKEFEDMLTDYNFFRVHNSHLINLNYIKSYNKGKGGYVTMTDDSSIEVSTRRKDEFLKKLMEV